MPSVGSGLQDSVQNYRGTQSCNCTGEEEEQSNDVGEELDKPIYCISVALLLKSRHRMPFCINNQIREVGKS